MKLRHKIAMPIMLIGIIAMWSLVPACSSADVGKAEKAAKEYAQNVPDATGKVTCVASDSDGDGYVSCTVFRTKGDPVAIECGSQKFCACNCAKGCKAAVAKIRGKR